MDIISIVAILVCCFLMVFLGILACLALDHLRHGLPNTRRRAIFELKNRAAWEQARQVLCARLRHPDYEAVQEYTGYPVPQVLRDFYDAPDFPEIEFFETPSYVPDEEGPVQLEFLPLDQQALAEYSPPNAGWLAFAIDSENATWCVSLEQVVDGDVPVYCVDSLYDPVEGPEQGPEPNAELKVADSLRELLAAGKRVPYPEEMKTGIPSGCLWG